MKISIAVPSYNYVQYIKACLDSIQSQHYQNFEVLIADGGSTDGSLQIIADYCKVDPRFRLVSTEDAGQADAIKKAFAFADGEILCFLNADDCYLNQNVLTEIMQAFQKNPEVSVVTAEGYYLDASGNKIKKINYRYHPLDGFHWMKYRTAIIQPATFWLRHVYTEASWPSHFHYVFDVVFFYQAYLNYKWLELKLPVAGYRLHGDNKSMSVRSKRIRELANFEQIKFGQGTFRYYYLMQLAKWVSCLEKQGNLGARLSKCLYLLVNSLAFATAYRLPGI